MKKVLEIIYVILGLFAVFLLIKGWKSFFSEEKVYIKYGEDIMHSTPFCPRLGVDEMDIEYMQESGKITGSEEFSRSESIKDLAIDMCPYCFSLYEINHRNGYYMNAYKEHYEEKVMEAKQKRKEKELEKLKKEYPKMFE